MTEPTTGNGREKKPIAWIETERYGDIDEVKQDLRELSKRADFEIMHFETGNSPNSNNGNKVVKAYTDSFGKIPKDELSIVREWINREVFWAQHVCNAKAKIEGGNGWENLTQNISKQEEEKKTSKHTDTKEENGETDGKAEQKLPSEIIRFHTSKNHFKDLLETQLESEIDSLKTAGDKVEIITMKSILKTPVEDKYCRKVKSISINEDKCEIGVSKQKIEKEEVVGETKNTGEKGSGKTEPQAFDKSKLFDGKTDQEQVRENEDELNRFDRLLDAMKNKKK